MICTIAELRQFFAVILVAGVLSSSCAMAQALSAPAEDTATDKAPSGPCNAGDIDRIPIRCWVGLKFLVLPKDKPAQAEGYTQIERWAPRYGHPIYDELAGRSVTVTKVAWQQYSLLPNASEWLVTFKTGEKGPFYNVTSTIVLGEGKDDAFVGCFAFMRDLQFAQDAYLGKHYWLLLPKLHAFNRAAGDARTEIPFSRFEPAVVTQVLASPMVSTPIRVVAKNTKGEEGYFDIAVSNINRSPSFGQAPQFSQVMSDIDPKASHNWPMNIWTAIENGDVLAGMTMDQVRFSLGSPINVTQTKVDGRSRAQWIYGDGKSLYFDDGILQRVTN